jgi:predicted ATPase/DNA-binding SARP family transcriptional activator
MKGDTAMARLVLELIGPFRVTLDGRPITSFAYDKVRALLVYLAVESGRAHHRNSLATLLWPDVTDERARANVRKALASLRQTLDDQNADTPFLLTTRDSIQFNRASDYTLDVTTFHTLLDGCATPPPSSDELDPNAIACMEQAIALYQGEFLAQVSTRGSIVFEEWAALVREELHRRALDTCAALMEHYQRRYVWDKAQRYARQLVQMEPWHEAGYRCIMRALTHSGQRGAALQQYELCRRILSAELGAEPEVATVALYEQIRLGTFQQESGVRGQGTGVREQGSGVRGQGKWEIAPSSHPHTPTPPLPYAPTPPLPYAPTVTLPTPVTSLVGREQEIATVCDVLRRADVRLLTLTGLGGMGKTRLSIAVAATLRDSFSGAVWFVPLASVIDTPLIINAIAQALGLQEAGDESMATRLITYLRDRPALLVLDNLEHLPDAGPLVGDLLATCPQLTILATSRVALRIYGEWEFVVPPLTLPQEGSIHSHNQVRESEAVQLFTTRAQAARHDFMLTDQNAEAVVAICRQLDGLPLAIELAAARIKHYEPQMLLHQLKRRLDLLTDGPRDAPERHRTLRAAIGWSYDALSADQQALFRRLGVFAGGCSPDAIDAVCGDWSAHHGDQSPILRRRSRQVSNLQSLISNHIVALADQHLIHQKARNTDTRFEMQELLREFALEQLAHHDELEQTRRAHAHHFLGLAEQAERHLRTGDQLTWLARLEEEHDNFRAALRWCLAEGGDVLVGLRLAAALGWFWWLHSHYTQGVAWLTRAFDQAKEAPAELRANVLRAASLLAVGLADSASGVAWGVEALEIYQTMGHSHAVAYTLGSLGAHYLLRDEYQRAAQCWEEGLALARAVDDRWVIAAYLWNLGMVDTEQERIRARCEESLRLGRETGDRWNIIGALHILSELALEQGDFSRAQRLVDECLALAREIGDRRNEAWALGALSGLAREQGDVERAAEYGSAFLRHAHEMGDRGNEAWALHNLGLVMLAQGNAAQGQTLFLDSIAQFPDHSPRGAAACLVGLASMMNDPTTAAQLLGTAAALLETSLTSLAPLDDRLYRRTSANLQSQLGADVFDDAWMSGRALSLQQAVELLGAHWNSWDLEGAFR